MDRMFPRKRNGKIDFSIIMFQFKFADKMTFNISNIKLTYGIILTTIISTYGLYKKAEILDYYDIVVKLPRHEKLMKKVNDKKMVDLDAKYQKKFEELGIQDGDVTFEKCKKAIENAKIEDEDEIALLTDYYAPGPVFQALRDDYTHRTIDQKAKKVTTQRPIELNVFGANCSSCKTMSYLNCMRIALRARHFQKVEDKKQWSESILGNYRLVEPYVLRNQNCDGKYMTTTIRNDIIHYIVGGKQK